MREKKITVLGYPFLAADRRTRNNGAQIRQNCTSAVGWIGQT